MKAFYLLAALSCFSSFVVSAQPETQTGYFIDSPVSGLYYETSSNLSGTTNKGAFEYNPGDIISFFIGNDNSGYLLTTLSAQQVITPTLSSTKPSRSILVVTSLRNLFSDWCNKLVRIKIMPLQRSHNSRQASKVSGIMQNSSWLQEKGNCDKTWQNDRMPNRITDQAQTLWLWCDLRESNGEPSKETFYEPSWMDDLGS